MSTVPVRARMASIRSGPHSTVVQLAGRRARCSSMRAASSGSSPADEGTSTVTGLPSCAASRSAACDFPERVPPMTRTIIAGAPVRASGRCLRRRPRAWRAARREPTSDRGPANCSALPSLGTSRQSVSLAVPVPSTPRSRSACVFASVIVTTALTSAASDRRTGLNATRLTVPTAGTGSADSGAAAHVGTWSPTVAYATTPSSRPRCPLLDGGRGQEPDAVPLASRLGRDPLEVITDVGARVVSLHLGVHDPRPEPDAAADGCRCDRDHRPRERPHEHRHRRRTDLVDRRGRGAQ